MTRVVLVGSSPQQPALFPFEAWRALTSAPTVLARAPDRHPSAPYLELADIPLERLEPARLELTGLDLAGPGSPDQRRLARALVDRGERDGEAVYLLGEEDGEGLTRAVGRETARRGVELEFVFHLQPRGAELLRLTAVEARLRDPDGGCPWDLEQDHRSLARYLVEETHELLDAIDSGDDRALAEELGDVLLQVVFHAQIASDRGAFDIDDVAGAIADKLVSRHPHVFGDVEVTGPEEVIANWEVLKQAEKQRTGPFEGVPAGLPALALADKLQRRAAKLGFDGDAVADPARQVAEELDEVVRAGNEDEREQEIGDLLGAVVALARHVDVDAETALRRAAARFRRRFEAVLEVAAERGLEPGELDRQRWLDLWEAVTTAER